jgi:Flp pilus assembly protein TadB
MGMSQLRWLDKTQPQTLMMATIIMYINAAFGLLDGMVTWFPIGTALVLGQVASGLGIANEKKWGYWLGVGLAALFVVFIVWHFSFFAIINLLFYGALLALLLHRQSREYRRVWFRW